MINRRKKRRVWITAIDVELNDTPDGEAIYRIHYAFDPQLHGEFARAVNPEDPKDVMWHAVMHHHYGKSLKVYLGAVTGDMRMVRTAFRRAFKEQK